MLYPQKLSSKKSELIIKIAILISIIIALILVIINRLTNQEIHWAALAGHVLVQLIAIAILTTYIDYRIGFKGWSLEMVIPIMIIVANITMLVLTIVSYKKYVKYAIYQLIICILSLIPIYFIYEHMVLNMVLSYVAIGISILNFILTIILCARDVKEAIIIKFHT